MLRRYESPHSELAIREHAFQQDRNASTGDDCLRDLLPIGAYFCTGVPPTLPGIPLRHSTPARLSDDAFGYKSSQLTPAPTSNNLAVMFRRPQSSDPTFIPPLPTAIGDNQVASAA